MPKTQRIIGYLAIWIALAFSTLANCGPAFACETEPGAVSSRPCCAMRSPGSCCHPASHRASRLAEGSGKCQMGGCLCNAAPLQNSAPQRSASVELSPLALLTPSPAIFLLTSPQRDLVTVCADPVLQSVPRSASSPRAPPFQG